MAQSTTKASSHAYDFSWGRVPPWIVYYTFGCWESKTVQEAQAYKLITWSLHGKARGAGDVSQSCLKGFTIRSCSFPCFLMSGRVSLGNVEGFLTSPPFQATDCPTRAVNTGLVYIRVWLQLSTSLNPSGRREYRKNICASLTTLYAHFLEFGLSSVFGKGFRYTLPNSLVIIEHFPELIRTT